MEGKCTQILETGQSWVAKNLGFWWVVFGVPKLLYMSLAWPQEYTLTSDCYKEIIKKGYL